ncbi:MAG: carboxypeptidase regulatory-like domain-containing protein [Burkholderiales bacterium]
MKASLIVSAALVTGALAAAPAFAADAATLPAVQQQGAVSFMTGGMREAQAQAMEQEADRYPLTLQFVRENTSGNSAVGDVRVSVRDSADKTVLSATGAGPLLLAKLPAGRYAVSAERGNSVKTQFVTLDGKRPDRIVFAWKS